MKCSFCHKTVREGAFMSEKDFCHALECLYPLTDYLYFHLMGEPLLHTKIKDFIRMASEKGFKVALTTNGALLDDSLADEPVYKVSVSLHSLEKAEKSEREGYIDRVSSFAKRASEKGVIVSLRLWNEGEKDNSETERLLKERFDGEWKRGRDGNITPAPLVFLEYKKPFCWPDMSEEPRDGVFCSGLRDQIGVLVDGTVVPCCLDADGKIPLGNLFEEDINEIITSPRATKIKEGFDRRVAVEELCKRCPYARRF